VGWIDKWRDEDYDTLETLIELGPGYHTREKVAGTLGWSVDDATYALLRLSWRKVVDIGPKDINDRATWRVSPKVMEKDGEE
jgi:hypothetical protein